jgi:salicylate hydroxylase
MKGDDLEIKYFGDFSHWPKKYGAEPYLLHRVDLHNGMKELALEGNGTNVAKLNLSSEVVDLDCESGTLTLANGEKFQKDLIVVADGVHVSQAIVQDFLS